MFSRYFEDDDEDAGGGDLEYQPAPGSPGRTRSSAAADSDSDDPLDAFMAGIDVSSTSSAVNTPPNTTW